MGFSERCAVFGLSAAVVLTNATTTHSGGLDGEPVLVVTAPAFVIVEAVVAAERYGQVAGVYSAAEPFDAVVNVGEYFDVLNCGAAANAAQGETVDFVTGANFSASVTDGNVAQNAGVVVVIVAAVSAATFVGGQTFNLTDEVTVGAGATENNDATPLATIVKSEIEGIGEIVSFSSEDDGVFGGAVSHDLAALRNDESGREVAGGRNGFTFDNGAGLDDEGGAVFDEYKSVHEVGFTGFEGYGFTGVDVGVGEVNHQVSGVTFSAERGPTVSPERFVRIESALVLHGSEEGVVNSYGAVSSGAGGGGTGVKRTVVGVADVVDLRINDGVVVVGEVSLNEVLIGNSVEVVTSAKLPPDVVGNQQVTSFEASA